MNISWRFLEVTLRFALRSFCRQTRDSKRCVPLSTDMSASEKKRISQDEFNCFMMDREKDMEVLTMVSPGLALAKKYIERGRLKA